LIGDGRGMLPLKAVLPEQIEKELWRDLAYNAMLFIWKVVLFHWGAIQPRELAAGDTQKQRCSVDFSCLCR